MKKTSLLLVFALLLTLFTAYGFARATDSVFSDVSEENWFYEGVQYAYEHGYMNGTDNSSFSPGLPTTRAMLVTILHRVEGSPSVPVDHGFADVKNIDYFNKAVMWASFNGIVNGYSATSFGPHDPITREQMATILYRYAVMKGYDVSSEGANLDAYDDANSISAFAREAMAWANSTKLIVGISSTSLAPAGTTIRAQAAVILSRFCQKYIVTETPVQMDSNETGDDAGNGPSNSEVDTETNVETGAGTGTETDHSADIEPDTGANTEPGTDDTESGVGTDTEPDDVTGSGTDTGMGTGTDVDTGANKETDDEANVKPEKNTAIDAATADPDAENLFLLHAAPGEGNTVELTLKLCGQVCLCGFDLRLLYDKDAYALKTLNTDCDLQVFSSRLDENGSVAMNYSAAQNIRKEKTVLKAVFEHVPDGNPEAVFSLMPVEIIMTDEAYDVIDANYTLTYCASL